MTQQLARTGAVRVTPFPTLLAAARAAGTGPGAVPRIAEETGAAFVVTGRVTGRGDSLFLETTVTDVRTGAAAARPEPVGVPRARVMEGVATMGRRVVAALAPGAGGARSTDGDAAVPPRFEAYRAYAMGVERFVASDWAGAFALCGQAAILDTGYAAPLLVAALAGANDGDLRAQDTMLRRLAPRRDRLSPYDAATYEAFEARVRGDHAAAYAALRRAAALAPGTVAHASLGAEALALGRPREAARVLDSLDGARGELRAFLPYWTSRTTAHHLLGRHTTEYYVAAQARALLPDSVAALALELRAMAGLGQCNRIVNRLDENPAAVTPAHVRMLAQECTAHGDSLVGAALAERAVEDARALVRREPRVSTALTLLEALAVARRFREAASLGDSLLAMAPDDADLRGRRGVLAVRLGDSVEMRAADSWLARPTTRPDHGRASLWRARLAASKNDVPAALALLQRAVREGLPLDRPFHADPDLLPARAAPRFVDWLRPKE
jgi:tetratricopeptide (TPR) repeat protein